MFHWILHIVPVLQVLQDSVLSAIGPWSESWVFELQISITEGQRTTMYLVVRNESSVDLSNQTQEKFKNAKSNSDHLGVGGVQ